MLYESAPVTVPEHIAEAAANVEAFVRRNEGRPELATVLAGFQASGRVTDGESITAASRDLLPAFFAHYWQREEDSRELLRTTVTCTCISSADENLQPDVIDDRKALAALTVPTLVVVGQYDIPLRTAVGAGTACPDPPLSAGRP